jgi:hypothetical protein
MVFLFHTSSPLYLAPRPSLFRTSSLQVWHFVSIEKELVGTFAPRLSPFHTSTRAGQAKSGVKSNPFDTWSLQTLDLGSNELGETAGQVIGEALKKNSTLQRTRFEFGFHGRISTK